MQLKAVNLQLHFSGGTGMEILQGRRDGGKRLIIVWTLGMLFIFYGVFFVFPVGYALAGSFCDWNPMVGKMNFAGVRNYWTILNSSLFWYSLKNTLYFTIAVVLLRTVFGILLANAVDSAKRFKSLFRTIFFMPVVTSLLAVSLIWVWILEPSSGIFNTVLSNLGLPHLGWLKDKNLALPSIMLMTLWKDTGFAMVLYLAGLSNISSSYYEAADIDGASGWQIFRYIKIPLLQPTTVIVVITGIIGYLQMFAQVFMMTEQAGPENATMTIVYMVYQEAFVNYNFGYASVITFILFVITLVFSMLQLRMSKNDWGE